jgi:hypothetical protein
MSQTRWEWWRILAMVLVILFWLLSIWVMFAAVNAFFQRLEPIPPEPPAELTEAIDPVPDWGAPRSDRWPEVRAAFVRSHPACEACGSVLELNVHHIAPFHSHPHLELDPSNLVTLCREHHFRVGHDPDGPWAPRRPNWREANPNVLEDAKLVRSGKKIPK